MLATPLNRLPLDIKAPPLSRCIKTLYHELDAAGIRFHPRCYLSNGWGCPDLVPLIGIPFHLARPDLMRLHREMGYDVEDPATVLRLLRHEAGHALCYAYRLYLRRAWRETFGPFHKAYVDHYIPNPFSREHVIYGKHYYAQKHPDEDFAEAFAVWLAPRSGWRTQYAGTAAAGKILLVDTLMKEIGSLPPLVRGGAEDCPVKEMPFTLLEFYGTSPGEHRRKASAYMDDVLSHVFPAAKRAGKKTSAGRFMAQNEKRIIHTVAFWAGVERREVLVIYRRFARRAARLSLITPPLRSHEALVNLVSLMTFYIYTYVHTRKFPVC
ncbi:MAG: hypothetical protein NT045_02200 [Candidatus Aureabacteria bacterium]|nr:hypothetical protein [Candidatus Auribacterota bacterium]